MAERRAAKKAGRKILVTATTFPRWKNDTEPAFVYELSKRLAAMGHDVTVLAPHHANAKKHEQMDGMQIVRFPYFWPDGLQKLCYDGGIMPNINKSLLARIQVPFLVLSECMALRKLLRQQDFDVIHAHWIVPQGYAAFRASGKLKIPYIVTAHAGDVFPLRSSFLRHFGRKAMLHAKFSTANSNYTKHKMQAIMGRGFPVEVIPMGVDLKTFRKASPRQAGLLRKKLAEAALQKGGKKTQGKKAPFARIILSVGRLAEKKGLRHLIDAMPIVLKKHPGSVLAIIGDGPERKSLEQQAMQLGIERHVLFLGKISNDRLPAYYSAADAFVLPSIIAKSGDTEGLGVVLLEAIACSLPCIASNVGGIPDIITHKQTGLLTEPGNHRDIADKICHLLSDRKTAGMLARNAIVHIEKNYDWDMIAGKFSNLASKC